MKKELALAFITVLLVTTPVFAAPGKNNSDQAKENHGATVSSEKKTERAVLEAEIETPEVTITQTPTVTMSPSLTPTTSPTPMTKKNGKNIEKAVQGAVTAQEDCNPNAVWSNHGAYVSCVAKTHPGGKEVAEAARSDIGKKHPESTPTATPSASPSVSPTLSPTPPVTSAGETVTLAGNPWEVFKNAVTRLIESLPFIPKHHHKG